MRITGRTPSIKLGLTAALCLIVLVVLNPLAQAADDQTRLYWGDTHLHTNLSLDAYTLMNRTAGPDTAYRYAKGLPVIHPYHRARVRIDTPLDFLAVTDHAEYAGALHAVVSNDPLVAESRLGEQFLELWNADEQRQAIYLVIASINDNTPDEVLINEQLRRSIWYKVVEAADRHNDPGKFTALSGWEWSSLVDGANLHRIVFTPQDGSIAKTFLPYSMFDSPNPEDLWAYLERTSRTTGADFVAIPHNSNLSKGKMFAEVDSAGRPIDAQYARARMKWEPIIEVTQIKGDSETHPLLSGADEFADFEFYPHLLDTRQGADRTPTVTPGDYARGALRRGLELEQKIGVNPYKFGLTGATDSHTGLASAEEDNFWGKTAIDSIPENKAGEVIAGSSGWDMSASGLTAVWASENTRDAITSAFKRKEVYATTGPRIQVRFFGGWDFVDADTKLPNLAEIGYEKGVPMGSDLAHVTASTSAKAPSFLVSAHMDANDAKLDRIQIIKGWVDKQGVSHEKIHNVALSGEGRVDSEGNVTPVGNTVDVSSAQWSNSIGAAQLTTVWRDPDFAATQQAFYYVRVLQIPTPRHSLYDALALDIDVQETKHAATIQERAYTSPIWYSP